MVILIITDRSCVYPSDVMGVIETAVHYALCSALMKLKQDIDPSSSKVG